MRLERIRNALRHPEIVPRYLAQRRKLLWARYRQRHNHGVFSVDIRRRTGFFAQLSWCTYILSYCHDAGLIPHVTSSNEFYVDPAHGPDCFGYFFERPEQAFIDANVVDSVGVRHSHDLGLPSRCYQQMTLERARFLLGRYMRVRPEIAAEVERFARDNFAGGPVLGVHFRATDKRTEAPPASPEHSVRVIRRFLVEHPEVERVFVASDVAPFVLLVRDEFPSHHVSFCDDQRSEGDRAVHRVTFAAGNYRKGREALLNCLLLSRCNALIRTASTLSGWASIFSPEIPVTMLNRPYPDRLWFPDRRILPRATIAEG